MFGIVEHYYPGDSLEVRKNTGQSACLQIGAKVPSMTLLSRYCY